MKSRYLRSAVDKPLHNGLSNLNDRLSALAKGSTTLEDGGFKRVPKFRVNIVPN